MPQNEELRDRTCSLLPDADVLIGYQMCSEVSYKRPREDNVNSSPYFPFTGPVSLTLTLNEYDAPRGFKFLAKHIEVCSVC